MSVDVDLSKLSMAKFLEQVLRGRGHDYLNTLRQKLASRDIVYQSDFLKFDKKVLETQLAKDKTWNCIEMGDAGSLHTAMRLQPSVDRRARSRSRSNKIARNRERMKTKSQNQCDFNADTKSGTSLESQYDDVVAELHKRGENPIDLLRRTKRNSTPRMEHQASSGSKRKAQEQGHRFVKQDNHARGNNCRHQRNSSRRHCNNVNDKQQSENNRNPEIKPALWEAVERNDLSAVHELLHQGNDPEEKHQGWTPLMKSAEENFSDIMIVLLEKKVDIEACNRKGRTALSFAAAPSMNKGERRETAVNTLRLLLEGGADPAKKDVRDMTAKDYALKEKRSDATTILEEYEA